MDTLLILALALPCVALLLGGWLGWQLLRQNGRLLLRLEDAEQRLDALEFGDGDAPQGQAPGNGDHASRFGNRSLARSRIKRDGLKAGTPAPDFRLSRLDGGELSLEEFRGRQLLLIFSDPHCGPCEVLAPEMQKFHREHPELAMLMISRGEPKDNRAKVKEHGLSFPVVLQQQWEISRRYAMFATPIAYLIDERGVIAADVALGIEAIQGLMMQSVTQRELSEVEV
jgi:peroxiredoxin